MYIEIETADRHKNQKTFKVSEWLIESDAACNNVSLSLAMQKHKIGYVNCEGLYGTVDGRCFGNKTCKTYLIQSLGQQSFMTFMR